ncbi:MAG: chromosomal replication initiator protein DnaA [Candidatus Magnetoovum sp. WYHC-5]|nr:chromosomal replication initiator protein DnaA [Candidatus Magnetoovum sp. WYHC-5]
MKAEKLKDYKLNGKGAVSGDLPQYAGVHSTVFNPKYTFSNFVVGESNKKAYEAAKGVCKNPGTLYNPLLIHGGVGLGKTHILGSIANEYVNANAIVDVMFISCEIFTDDVIHSIRQKTLKTLENKYNALSMFLIDDVHFISNSEQTQEVFINIFHYFYERKKQIVLTSDKPPESLGNITESLKRCFKLGFLAEVLPPSMETKVSILQKKAELENIELSDDVVYFLASSLGSNIRELEGSLLKLSAHANFTGNSIDLEITKKLLKDLIMIKPDVVDIESILHVICQHFGIGINDISSTKRTKDVLLPRQLAMYILKRLTSLSFEEIGLQFGKDHSTVIYSCNQVERKLKDNEFLSKTIDKLMNKITKL